MRGEKKIRSRVNGVLSDSKQAKESCSALVVTTGSQSSWSKSDNEVKNGIRYEPITAPNTHYNMMLTL